MSQGSGGAVYGYGSSTISISGSSFASNTASVRTIGRGEEGVGAGYVGVRMLHVGRWANTGG